ncbi:MAG: EAL domain-containing protein [Lachnospiraceae bacterium]|nr:EAL domain-containing protein [Lachnospiraceae bacterium]
MEKNLKRAEALTQTVQLLESDRPFEAVCIRMLEVVGKYLDISSTQLLQISPDGKTVDVIGEWLGEGIVSIFDHTKGIERPPVIKGDKPVFISKDTIISKEAKAFLEQVFDRAFIAMPLFANGNVVMYWCLNECRHERMWSLSDIHFVNDVTKVMQSILTKRIQKYSLASSYASLQAILDNVGSAIYVKDIDTNQLLFANKVLRQEFERELKEGTMEEVLNSADSLGREGYFEINYADRNRWYDLLVHKITWVDGREVSLCAMFDITDKKIYQRKIEQQAYTDFLTGLYNRMCFERDLAGEIDRAKVKGATGALLYLDLDDFKHINDGLGHQYGDVLLKAISSSLKRVSGIEDYCYRIGGDEFVIIIPSSGYAQYDRIIREIKHIFSKPWFLKDADYYCTMSMGVVEFPGEGESVQDLIKKADIAMYEAKKSGKNRLAHYSDDLSRESNKRLDMEKNMRDATCTGYEEFEVYYQPIVDVTDKPRCTGAEALIRWNSSTLGFIPPSDFIPLAEYLGLINPIGNHVMRSACAACKRWNDLGKRDYKVNVNLSVVQLLQTDIVESVQQALDETGLNPHNLTLEVTESLAINDMERMKDILNRIRALGVRIALDDFGTGYSSLNHIREIPLDVIKVDQNFVRDLAEDTYSRSFIRMVGELADAIGVNVCVEGIETKSQFEVLEGMRVQLIQGYYFDKPMPFKDFERKYVIAK